MAIQIDCYGDSHVGRHRPANEDQFLIADLNKSMRIHQTSLGLNHQTRLFGGSQGKLLLVADGLGGHEAGERASTLAVDGVTSYILNAMDWVFRLNASNEADFETDLKKAFRHSQEILQVEAEAMPQRRGMATTLTMAYIDWPKLYVVHVGDTRCYLMHAGQIQCLTTDHTVGELVRAAARNEQGDGDGEDKLSENPLNQTLWNVIGGRDQALDPQISRSQLAVGDALLLCSDGLTRYLSETEILAAVSEEQRTAQQICQHLIGEANERGGQDNITVVLAKFTTNGPDVEDQEQAVVNTDGVVDKVLVS